MTLVKDQKVVCPDCAGGGVKEHPSNGPYTCRGCLGHGFVMVPTGWKPLKTYCAEHGIHMCDNHEGGS